MAAKTSPNVKRDKKNESASSRQGWFDGPGDWPVIEGAGSCGVHDDDEGDNDDEAATVAPTLSLMTEQVLIAAGSVISTRKRTDVSMGSVTQTHEYSTPSKQFEESARV